MPDIPQHRMRWLSGVRSRLLLARTPSDVLSALSDEVVPAWADELSLVARDAGAPLPSRLWEAVPDSTVWLCPDAGEPGPAGGWVTVDVGGDAQVPPAPRAAIPLAAGGDPALVVLERGAGRAGWTPLELALVNEAVRLAEFALGALEQQRRTQEGRTVGDAAAHRWAAFARLSRRLARSVMLDDVAASILTAVVPYLADWALLDVLTPEQTAERVGWRHAMPDQEPRLERLVRFPFGAEAKPSAIGRLGTGWLLPEAGPEQLARLAGEGELAGLEELAPRSVAVVPLVAGKRPVGALTLVTSASGQRYEPGDLALFRSLASQAALALDSARLYRDAERARMEREEVIAMVSHDLKNPLNVLGFALAILGQEGIPEEKKAPQLGVIQRSIAQMEELVNNLLDAARIDAGRFSVSSVPQDAAQLARDALQRAQPLADQAGVRLEAEGTHDLPPILADRGRLMQVFANLLDNAISFTPAQGRVCLRASADEAVVRFEIEDSGPGLDPEAMEHVFDRFWRARHSGHAGAGLGLAIARGVVEAHGGTIGVRSAPQSGAVFHFSIPRVPAEDPGPGAPGPQDPPSP